MLIRRSCFAAVAAVAATCPLRALDGHVEFSIPSGAVSCEWEIYDKDFRGDDLLETGSMRLGPDDQPPDKLEVDFEDLECKGGDVVGPEGSSGEGNAEILVKLKWNFPSGNTAHKQAETTLSCKRKAPQSKKP